MIQCERCGMKSITHLDNEFNEFAVIDGQMLCRICFPSNDKAAPTHQSIMARLSRDNLKPCAVCLRIDCKKGNCKAINYGYN